MPPPKIGIVYYSLYGHVRTLAREIADGIDATGCSAHLLQVPETLSKKELITMNAPPKPPDEVATSGVLADYDGIIFGTPTRFGGTCTQITAFMDTLLGPKGVTRKDRHGRELKDDEGVHRVSIPDDSWRHNELAGKPAGVFVSTGTQNGGMETTASHMYTRLVHYGMLLVPLGYKCPLLNDMKEIHGASAWGPGCLAGADGSRQPSEIEREIAMYYGTQFGHIAWQLSKPPDMD